MDDIKYRREKLTTKAKVFSVMVLILLVRIGFVESASGSVYADEIDECAELEASVWNDLVDDQWVDLTPKLRSDPEFKNRIFDVLYGTKQVAFDRDARISILMGNSSLHPGLEVASRKDFERAFRRLFTKRAQQGGHATTHQSIFEYDKYIQGSARFHYAVGKQDFIDRFLVSPVRNDCYLALSLSLEVGASRSDGLLQMDEIAKEFSVRTGQVERNNVDLNQSGDRLLTATIRLIAALIALSIIVSLQVRKWLAEISYSFRSRLVFLVLAFFVFCHTAMVAYLYLSERLLLLSGASIILVLSVLLTILAMIVLPLFRSRTRTVYMAYVASFLYCVVFLFGAFEKFGLSFFGDSWIGPTFILSALVGNFLREEIWQRLQL